LSFLFFGVGKLDPPAVVLYTWSVCSYSCPPGLRLVPGPICLGFHCPLRSLPHPSFPYKNRSPRYCPLIETVLSLFALAQLEMDTPPLTPISVRLFRCSFPTWLPPPLPYPRIPHMGPLPLREGDSSFLTGFPLPSFRTPAFPTGSYASVFAALRRLPLGPGLTFRRDSNLACLFFPRFRQTPLLCFQATRRGDCMRGRNG